jgi:hypothetical protein
MLATMRSEMQAALDITAVPSGSELSP